VIALLAALRELPKHDDLPSTHAEGLLGLSMQRALDTMDVDVNDIRASSARVYKYVLDLAEALEDGADVGLVGVWR
jgi:hypothetical protein